MASEPDDYQSISDNCPGYMVLIPEGIVCTRCAGEKRHKKTECPKASTAASRATSPAVPQTEGTGSDNADSEMESLSDTDSVSSEWTGRYETSETRGSSAHQSDQGGNHPQDTRHVPRRGFAGPDSHTSTKPDHSGPLPPKNRAARQVSSSSNRASQGQGGSFSNSDSSASDTASRKPKTSGSPKSGATPPTELPSSSQNASIKQRNGRRHRRSHSQHGSVQQPGPRSTRPSLGDTTGKFDYSNTTCPSSFGFGRLPSESMG